jgi:hypothetical protein
MYQKARCKNCKFWEETGKSEQEFIRVGFCHRWPPLQPPLVNPHGEPSDFIVSRCCDWCGEYAPKPENIYKRLISKCDLSVRSKKILSRIGLLTVGDLVGLEDAEDKLLRERNCGQYSLLEIKSFLYDNGLKFKESLS